MPRSSGFPSSPPQTPPQKAPKAMSSRLLTMKFMQRAAASSSPAAPSSPEQPSPKRRRTDDPSSIFDVDSLVNQRAVQSALADEEAKRQAVLDKQAAEAGDTRWVLNFKSEGKSPNRDNITASTIRVIPAGFAAIDKVSFTTNHEVSVDSAGVVGRKSFGKFNRVIEKLQNPDYESSSDSDSNEDTYYKFSSEDENEDPETMALIREEREEAAKKLKTERKAKRKAEKAELVRLAEKRKKRNVNLNESRNLTSISSGGGDMRTCHNCGEIGHQFSECPRPCQKSRRRDDKDQIHSANKARKPR